MAAMCYSLGGVGPVGGVWGLECGGLYCLAHQTMHPLRTLWSPRLGTKVHSPCTLSSGSQERKHIIMVPLL